MSVLIVVILTPVIIGVISYYSLLHYMDGYKFRVCTFHPPLVSPFNAYTFSYFWSKRSTYYYCIGITFWLLCNILVIILHGSIHVCVAGLSIYSRRVTILNYYSLTFENSESRKFAREKRWYYICSMRYYLRREKYKMQVCKQQDDWNQGLI